MESSGEYRAVEYNDFSSEVEEVTSPEPAACKSCGQHYTFSDVVNGHECGVLVRHHGQSKISTRLQ